jgi:4-amino-4-deoxy-L-arabinose transferase-like glycosyltransferase
MNGNGTPLAAIGWLPFLWQRVLFPGTACTDTRVRPLALLLIALLPAVLLYPTRSFYLLEPDEGRYAQIPREMLESGDWVVPTLQSEPYLDKPPLLYWLVALSYKAFGVTPAAARLVPAICVHLTILAVYLIGRRSLGHRAAAWAALFLTVAPAYHEIARLLILDGLLTLCVTLSILCGFEAVRTGRLKLGWWVAAATASGLGFLTKGPVAEVLFFPPLFAFGWLSGSTARIRLWRYALFFAVVLGVSLPWYVAIYLRQPTFLRYFLWEHNVMRFVQPFAHLEPVWYYVPIMLAGFMPGTLLFAGYFRKLLFKPNGNFSTAGGFWLLTGGWCVLFFSLSGSKLPTYVLPAFPFLCLALGDYVAKSKWDASSATRILVVGFAGLLGFVNYVGLPWYAKERSPVGRPELVLPYVRDPSVPVITYPRTCDSVAFAVGRKDFDPVRSKNINDMILASHFRPKTVVLFTHRHSFEAFREALPPSLTIMDVVELKHAARGLPWLEKLVGDSPWGLCHVVVLQPTPAVDSGG